jgi:Arc/MetJ-type ribon-helix-helix transcriptional regulator
MAPDDDEFIEEEVKLEEDTLYVMDRLVEEGWFTERSDFMIYSVQNWNANFEGDFSVDPSLDQRIKELNQINRAVEDEFLLDFFVDTSYLMQEHARLASDTGSDLQMKRISAYMAHEFAGILGADDLSYDRAEDFIDRTVDLTNDFWNLSDAANEGYEGVIEEYEDTYFEEDERLADLLVEQ